MFSFVGCCVCCLCCGCVTLRWVLPCCFAFVRIVGFSLFVFDLFAGLDGLFCLFTCWCLVILGAVGCFVVYNCVWLVVC